MANYNSSHTGAEIDSAIGRVKDTAVTAGTISANLGVVVDANKDISGFRNVTLTGQLQAATINLTGDTTIGDGDTDNITINADVNSNIIPNTDNTFDLGSASKQWKDLYVNGIGYIDQLGTDADPIAIYASSGEIDGTAIGSESASTGAFTTISASGNVDFNGDLDVDGTTNLDVVDIDGAVDMASTLAVGTYFSLKTTDDQANSWVLYTNTNDSLEFNYNGSGNAEVVVDNSGNVGIGTTNPTIPLVVGANGDPTIATIAAFINTNDGGVASIMIQNDAGGGSTDETNEIVSRTSNRRNGKIVFGREADQSSTANADSFLQLHTATNNVNNAAIHIDSSQRVGIGVTSPAYPLDVRTSSGTATLQVRAPNDADARIRLIADDQDDNADNFQIIHTASDNDIEFQRWNGSAWRSDLTIDSSGQIGIGTASPTGLLEVANTSGNADIRIRSSNSGNSRLYFGDVADVGAGFVDYDHGTAMYFGTEGSTRMAITSGGRVGINDTNPGSPLDVKSGEASNTANFNSTSGATNITFESSGSLIGQMEFVSSGTSQIVTRSSATLALGSNNVQTLFITDNDKVGVGTANPTSGILVVRGSGDLLTLESTNSGTGGAQINLNHVGGSQADGDSVGRILFNGQDSNDNAVSYARIDGIAEDVTDGSENGALNFDTRTSNSSFTTKMRIDSYGHMYLGGDASGGTPALYFYNNATARAFIQASGTGLIIDTDSFIQFKPNNTVSLDLYSDKSAQFHGTPYPSGNNTINLGASGSRWSVIYTSNSVNVSDKTTKENIADCNLGVDFINTLKPKSYKMKDLKEGHDDYGRKHFGLIAQDLIDTELNDSVFGDKDGEYSLAYNDIIAPLIKAVQELSAQNDLLTARIEALEA